MHVVVCSVEGDAFLTIVRNVTDAVALVVILGENSGAYGECYRDSK